MKYLTELSPLAPFIDCLLTVACVIFQTKLLILREREMYFDDIRKYRRLQEITVLVTYILVFYELATVTGCMLYNREYVPHIDVVRYIAFVFIVCASGLMYQEKKMLRDFIPPIALLFTTPFLEWLCGEYFAVVLPMTLMVMGTRSVICIITMKIDMKRGMYVISFNKALNEVDTGLLFYKKSGTVLMCNDRMKQVIMELWGDRVIDGNAFYDELCKQCGNTLVTTLSDNSKWLFRRTLINIRREEVFELTAIDVTERVRVNNELNSIRETLAERENELREHLENIVEYAEEEAAAKMRLRAHDLLGERLTIMLRTLREGPEGVDYNLLADRLGGVVEEIKAEEAETTPDQEFQSMVEAFALMDVTVSLEGKLPSDPDSEEAVVEVIREAVTNAVRHAYSSEIVIKSFASAEGWRVTITNNGNPCHGQPVEGNGIKGMRRKIARVGGILAVLTQPRFTISILLPRG